MIRNVESGKSVGGRVGAGLAFFLGSRLLVRALGLVNLAVLGRLLSPADFGVIALAMVVIGLNEAVQNRQFEYALIRIADPSSAHFATAFGLGLCLGGMIATAIFVAAESVATLMDAPDLVLVLRWLALVPLIDGLRNPYVIRFERDLRFEPTAMIETVSRLSLTVVAILLALAFRNYWAMVGGILVAVTVRTTLTHVVGGRAPGIDLSCWREFARFGGWMSSAGLVGFLEMRLATIAAGAFFTVEAVGVFNVGSEMAMLITLGMAQPFVSAFYPGLVAVDGDNIRFRQAYLKTQTAVLAMFLPVGVGAAMTAPEIVRVLLGAEWEPTVVILQWLAPAMAFATLSTAVVAATMAKGETRRHAEIAGVGVIVQILALALGLSTFGVMGLVYARIVSLAARAVLAVWVGARLTTDSVVAPFRAAWRSIAAVAIMAFVVSLARFVLSPGDTFARAVENLLIMGIGGVVIYVIAHILLWRAAGSPNGIERSALAALASVRAKFARR